MKRLIAIAIVMSTAFLARDRATAASTPQFTGSEIAAGVAAPFRIHTSALTMNQRGRTDVQNWTVKWDPGAKSGWHSHAGLVVVTILSGTVTVYNHTATGCTRNTFGKGRAFVEIPFQVHDAINLGSVPVKAVSSELISHGQSETINASHPSNCPKV